MRRWCATARRAGLLAAADDLLPSGPLNLTYRVSASLSLITLTMIACGPQGGDSDGSTGSSTGDGVTDSPGTSAARRNAKNPEITRIRAAAVQSASRIRLRPGGRVPGVVPPPVTRLLPVAMGTARAQG